MRMSRALWCIAQCTSTGLVHLLHTMSETGGVAYHGPRRSALRLLPNTFSAYLAHRHILLIEQESRFLGILSPGAHLS